MKFSQRWIAEFVELTETSEVLAARLTAAGLAVEGIEARADGDAILDIDVTSNRPDCMNHRGIARELSAILARPLKPLPQATRFAAARAADFAKVSVEEPAGCPRFCAVVVRGVKIGPSPAWLVERLKSIGSRSINNVVDVTNYVMWEMGQPLHAYDLAKLAGAELRVRLARAGEVLVTLDGEKRQLEADHLVIADAEQPVGLAGVMGGLDSEVTDATVDILLEAGHFSPSAVRRATKKLGMHTDAAHRFERGADPEACPLALSRAASLMVELAGGELLEGVLDVANPLPSWPPRLEIDHGKLCRFGGVEIPATEARRIFVALGFGVEGEENRPVLQAPSWRYYDFQQPYPQDFYEEVLRIYGFDRVPTTLPAIAGADAPVRPEHQRRQRVQDHLAGCGLAEAINFAFHDRASDENYPSLVAERPALELVNPLSDLYAVMRRSLLPNLVAAARFNQRRGAGAVRLFEVGHVFYAGDDGQSAEMDNLAIVIGGAIGTPWERAKTLDFYDLKGILESLFDRLGVEVTWREQETVGLLPGTSAALTSREGRVVGVVGQLAATEGGYPLFVAEIGLELLGEASQSLLVNPPSRFPGIAVDTTLTHDLAISWQELANAIAAGQVADLVSFTLKDRYRGKGVPEGAVNTTISFAYNSEASSLTQESVNERHLALVARLEAEFAWKRGTV